MKKLYMSSLVSPALLNGQAFLYNHTIFFTPKFNFMYKFTLRIFASLCILGMSSVNSFAQNNISAGGSSYTQNFDAMGTSGNLPAGWKADSVTTPRTVGSYGTALTTTGHLGGANMPSTNAAGDAGIYNFGNGTTSTGGTDRAVGGLNTSNNPTSVNIYLQLTNNGATPITQLAISYKIEKYRNGKNSDSSAVQLWYLNGATWVNLGAPFYSTFAPDADNNGYATAPDAAKTVTVNAVYNLPAAVALNGTLTFAWNISQGVAATGANASNSPALGIDDVRITATAAGPAALYFQSNSNGNWSDVNMWQYSSDGITWNAPPAPHYPTFFDNTILIQGGHTVNVDVNVTTDQTTVNGALVINSGMALSVDDGSGFDITVNNPGSISGADATARLIIKSEYTGTDAGTASVGPSTGIITVPTTVERLISSVYNRSAWRFLTAPLTSTGSIFSNWQNGGTYAAGIGSVVTGPTYLSAAGGSEGNPVTDANGLDYFTPGASMYTFNTATQQLAAVTNTTAPLSSATDNIGYYMFIRGDRHSTTASPNQTTLKATGSLQVGTKSFTTSATANAITLVGNPYASAIDLDKFNTDNFSASNVKSSYYYWDPYLSGDYGVGGYVTVSYASAGGTPTITPLNNSSCASTCGNETKYLQSGQAMFLVTKSAGGSGSVVFNEAQKDPTSVNNIFRTLSGKVENLRVNLLVLHNGTPALLDGIAADFDKSYSLKADDLDAGKFYNPGESIAFMRDNKALAVERLPLNTGSVLNLNLYQLKANITYQLEINHSISNGATAYLVDNYLKTTTQLDANRSTVITFTVNGDAASTGSNRFYISFAKPAVVVAQGKDGLSVFPNPVTNGVINLQMNNMPQGIYNVRVMNGIGQVIVTRQLNHSAGNSTETIQLGKGAVKGIYQLEVVKPDNTKFSSKVIAN